jgi:uncharacterized protein YdeI (BOF family)
MKLSHTSYVAGVLCMLALPAFSQTEQGEPLVNDDLNLTRKAQQYQQNQAVAERQFPAGEDTVRNFSTVAELPSEGQVTLSGIIMEIEDEDGFTLKDKTGSIEIDLAASSDSLQVGQQVTITGEVQKSWFGTREIENAIIMPAE